MMNELPLDGLRVVDFSWVINGPITTSWLAAMGAEVIRVESAAAPDIIRRMRVVSLDMKPGLERSGEFHFLNFNKKSCTLNLAVPGAHELAMELVRKSDIAVQTFVPTVAKRLQLTYQDMVNVKTDIIYMAMSLFGSWGPVGHWKGWGPVANAFCGLSSITGYKSGEPRGIASAWPDHQVAPAAVFLILSALWHRDRTGEGQWIDLSMAEVVQSMIPEFFIDYALTGEVAQPMGNEHPSMAPHGTYPCKGEDRWVAIAVKNEEEWRSLCELMGSPAWTREERFASASGRRENRELLDQRIGEWTANCTSYEIATMLQNAGIAAAPCLDAYELLEDPHLKDRGLFFEMDHPETGRRRGPGLPFIMNDLKISYSRAPLLGEHNDYVFGRLLELSQSEIQKLKENKIIF